MNPPLARALRGVGLDAPAVAARLGVDPKTVSRWLSGRVPYPRHRAALERLTGWAARDLWPSEGGRGTADQARRELRAVYPHRSAVPANQWRRLFAGAEREIGIAAYSALFLAEDAATQRVIRERARAGVRVRVALGDPTGRHVAERGAEEGIDAVMTARIRNALILLRPLADEPGVQVRLHDTVLYNSIYQADDQLLVNTHAFGAPAFLTPVLHLTRTADDGVAAAYLASFERIWDSASDF